MADKKLPLTDFQNVILGGATLLAFGAGVIRDKKVPNFWTLLSLGGALQPLAAVDWKAVVPEALDMDADENAGLKAAIATKFPNAADAKVKDLIVAVIDVSAPAMELYTKGTNLIAKVKDAFGSTPAAAPATT